MSDRIAVMNKGEILQVGTPREIYELPEHRFVAEFIGHSNFFQGTVEPGSTAQLTVVNCRGRPLAGKCLRAPQPGSPATLSLRYEKIALNATPADGDWRGTVEKITFTGPSVRVDVKLPEDLVATVELPAGTTNANLAVGQAVGLAWSPGNANVLLD